MDSPIVIESEINTFKLEVQDVAFALKVDSKNNVYDVIFNKYYNGEFYIKDNNGKTKEITKEELKNKILELGNNQEQIKNFLENQLLMEKLIEKTREEIEEEAKTKNLKIPEQLQKIIYNLINNKIENYAEKMEKLNNLIELYYNIEENKEKNIKKNKQKELLTEDIEKLLEDESKYKYCLYDGYIDPINVDKLLKHYNKFNEEQQKNIVKKNRKSYK